MKILYKLLLSAIACPLLCACFQRELDDNENYVNLKRSETIADNEELRLKTFKIGDYDRYIIFGNNNEVSIDGQAQLPFYLYINGNTRSATINLVGCTYEYTAGESKLLFKEALIKSADLGEEPLLADVLFRFEPISSSGLDRYRLQLQSITLPSGEVMSLGKKVSYASFKELGFIAQFSYTLIYYRN